MKISEVLAQLASIKPHSYPDETLYGWLSQLEWLIYEEVMLSHKDAPEQPPEPYEVGGEDVDLMVPDPYSKLYLSFLAAKIDFSNGDYGRYNNDMVMYNTDLQTYTDWYNRKHMPIQKPLRW